MVPYKCTDEQRDSIVESCDRAEKDSRWADKHELVRDIKEEFPMVHCLEECVMNDADKERKYCEIHSITKDDYHEQERSECERLNLVQNVLNETSDR